MAPGYGKEDEHTTKENVKYVSVKENVFSTDKPNKISMEIFRGKKQIS